MPSTECDEMPEHLQASVKRERVLAFTLFKLARILNLWPEKSPPFLHAYLFTFHGDYHKNSMKFNRNSRKFLI